MTLDDWSIFCKYRHHVRSLRTNVYPIRVGAEIWRALRCPPFPLPLLPNLMSLTWSSDSNETFLRMRLFVSPKITTLDLIPDTFDPSEHSVLSCIAMLCHSVSHFR
ncbi:hypothetical protein DFJ58DRAFT_228909, partial [Suillus subalutaceus]|uniref:uncharacterized protein n=1 Tax=Suillus subalutaceus TaxID=48586 RepID=UPI001B87C5A8